MDPKEISNQWKSEKGFSCIPARVIFTVMCKCIDAPGQMTCSLDFRCKDKNTYVIWAGCSNFCMQLYTDSTLKMCDSYLISYKDVFIVTVHRKANK